MRKPESFPILCTNDPIPGERQPIPFTRLRFDRHELAGSVGDLGTDLPLIVGMIVTAGLDPASVLVTFGLFQIATGVLYGLPMPMQPLKAMAAVVIAGGATAAELYGGGLAIGAVMLVLSLTGSLTWLARVISKPVVRGIQIGLGLMLADVALRRFLPDLGATGYLLAIVGFAILLIGRWRSAWWAGPAVVTLGLVTTAFTVSWSAIGAGMGLSLPKPHVPHWGEIATGFLLLALPQLPLSLSNSVIATTQTIADLFPERSVSVRKIGLTYSVANLLAPWLSGIPVCHGCGGLAGHYALGARTGGSVVLYGAGFLVLGLFLAGAFGELAEAFPLPLLGVLLAFEALALLSLAQDLAGSNRDWKIALIVAVCAFWLPQGFAVGVVIGILLDHFLPQAEKNGATR
jgi:hypothetical protein